MPLSRYTFVISLDAVLNCVARVSWSSSSGADNIRSAFQETTPRGQVREVARVWRDVAKQPELHLCSSSGWATTGIHFMAEAFPYREIETQRYLRARPNFCRRSLHAPLCSVKGPPIKPAANDIMSSKLDIIFKDQSYEYPLPCSDLNQQPQCHSYYNCPLVSSARPRPRRAQHCVFYLQPDCMNSLISWT